MGSHDVVVRQLATYTNKSVINVEGEGGGHLILYGSALHSPSYLLRRGVEWSLVVFDDMEWRDELWAEVSEHYDEMVKIDRGGLLQVETLDGLPNR